MIVGLHILIPTIYTEFDQNYSTCDQLRGQANSKPQEMMICYKNAKISFVPNIYIS